MTSPLAFAFIVQEFPYSQAQNIILENAEKQDNFMKNIYALQEIGVVSQSYRSIRTSLDRTYQKVHTNTIGVWITEAVLHPHEMNESVMLTLEVGKQFSEKMCIDWLTSHEYSVGEYQTPGTYVRRGDVIQIYTDIDHIRVSFFAGTIEQIWQNDREIQSTTLLPYSETI